MVILIAFFAVIAKARPVYYWYSSLDNLHLDVDESGWFIAPAFQKYMQNIKLPSFATIVTGIVVGLPIYIYG